MLKDGLLFEFNNLLIVRCILALDLLALGIVFIGASSDKNTEKKFLNFLLSCEMYIFQNDSKSQKIVIDGKLYHPFLVTYIEINVVEVSKANIRCNFNKRHFGFATACFLFRDVFSLIRDPSGVKVGSINTNCQFCLPLCG